VSRLSYRATIESSLADHRTEHGTAITSKLTKTAPEPSVGITQVVNSGPSEKSMGKIKTQPWGWVSTLTNDNPPLS